MKYSFFAWPVDEGEAGVRLDIDIDRTCDLPPCPGLGGWKGESGAYWTRIKGPLAFKVSNLLRSHPYGFHQPVEVFMEDNVVQNITLA